MSCWLCFNMFHSFPIFYRFEDHCKIFKHEFYCKTTCLGGLGNHCVSVDVRIVTTYRLET